jgi:hypothetical protein
MCAHAIDNCQPSFGIDLDQSSSPATRRGFYIFASLRPASIRAPGEAKLVISHNLRRLNAVSC